MRCVTCTDQSACVLMISELFALFFLLLHTCYWNLSINCHCSAIMTMLGESYSTFILFNMGTYHITIELPLVGHSRLIINSRFLLVNNQD